MVRKRHSDMTTKFDRVFWLGDLNYRIDLPRDQVEKVLASPCVYYCLDAVRGLCASSLEGLHVASANIHRPPRTLA